MTRRALGEFEHQVLLCILRNGSESYSVEIVLELESRQHYLSLWDGVEALLDEV